MLLESHYLLLGYNSWRLLKAHMSLITSITGWVFSAGCLASALLSPGAGWSSVLCPFWAGSVSPSFLLLLEAWPSTSTLSFFLVVCSRTFPCREVQAQISSQRCQIDILWHAFMLAVPGRKTGTWVLKCIEGPDSCLSLLGCWVKWICQQACDHFFRSHQSPSLSLTAQENVAPKFLWLAHTISGHRKLQMQNKRCLNSKFSNDACVTVTDAHYLEEGHKVYFFQIPEDLGLPFLPVKHVCVVVNLPPLLGSHFTQPLGLLQLGFRKLLNLCKAKL